MEVAYPFDCIVELLLKAGPGIWPGMGRAASGKSAGRLRTLSQCRCFMKETVRDDLVLAFTSLCLSCSAYLFDFVVYPVQSQVCWMRHRSILDGSLKLMASTSWLI